VYYLGPLSGDLDGELQPAPVRSGENPNTPQLFNLTASPYDYDPAATMPY
jgi:hypothetical protein